MDEVCDECLEGERVAQEGEDIQEIDTLRGGRQLSSRNQWTKTCRLWEVRVSNEQRLQVLHVGHRCRIDPG